MALRLGTAATDCQASRLVRTLQEVCAMVLGAHHDASERRGLSGVATLAGTESGVSLAQCGLRTGVRLAASLAKVATPDSAEILLTQVRIWFA